MHQFFIQTIKDKNQIATLCLLDEGLCISGYFLSPQTQKTDKISPSLDKRYLEEYHQPSSAKLTQMSTESEALSTTNIKTATNIENQICLNFLEFVRQMMSQQSTDSLSK
jgi:hypothetical protein